MRRTHAAQLLGMLGGDGGESLFDPVLSLGSKLVAMAWAPWEGGNAPAHVAARAQNPSITTGTALSTITEWSGNSSHFVRDFGTGAVWTTGQMNGNPAFVCASQSYQQASQDAMNANFSVIAVYNNTGAGGAIYQGDVNSSPQMLARSTGLIEWYDPVGNTSTAMPLNTPHVITRHITATQTLRRLNGTEVAAVNSVHNHGTNYINGWLSNEFNSARLAGDVMGWFAVRDLSAVDLLLLESWAATPAGIILAGP